jgi:hypothetical protein
MGSWPCDWDKNRILINVQDETTGTVIELFLTIKVVVKTVEAAKHICGTNCNTDWSCVWSKY